MSDIGKSERITQNRIIALFRDELEYRYLGDWQDRDGNSNIEGSLLTAYLTQERLQPRADQQRHIQTARRGGQSQPRPLRQQQGGVQSAALRCAGEDRGGQGHRNGQANQLGQNRKRTTSPLPKKSRCTATTNDGPILCSM